MLDLDLLMKTVTITDKITFQDSNLSNYDEVQDKKILSQTFHTGQHYREISLQHIRYHYEASVCLCVRVCLSMFFLVFMSHLAGPHNETKAATYI